MKKKISSLIENLKLIAIKTANYFLVKTKPLQEEYKKRAKTKYGRLIRMDSYNVYPMLFLPTWCAIAMADRSDDFTARALLFLLFGLGAFLMRSAGCILNDLIDIKIDRQVYRTQNRPLVSGEVTIPEALNVLVVMLVLSLIVLFSLPKHVIIIGIIAAAMVVLYPFAKRFTHLAQLVLGITFNAGVLIGWLTVNNHSYFQLIMLYLGFSLFTFAYDTIYACQDLEDDLEAGVKSFPVLLKTKGRDIKAVVWHLYKLAVTCIGIAGLGMNMNSSFFLCLAAATYILYNALELCDINSPESCSKHFRKSNIFLLILFLGTLFGK